MEKLSRLRSLRRHRRPSASSGSSHHTTNSTTTSSSSSASSSPTSPSDSLALSLKSLPPLPHPVRHIERPPGPINIIDLSAENIISIVTLARESDQHIPMSLSLVNHHFRAMLLGSPSVWNLITLKMVSTRGPAYVKQYIDRSGFGLLNVRADIMIGIPVESEISQAYMTRINSTYDDLLAALLPYATRIQTFRMVVPHFGWIRQVWPLIRKLSHVEGIVLGLGTKSARFSRWSIPGCEVDSLDWKEFTGHPQYIKLVGLPCKDKQECLGGIERFKYQGPLRHGLHPSFPRFVQWLQSTSKTIISLDLHSVRFPTDLSIDDPNLPLSPQLFPNLEEVEFLNTPIHTIGCIMKFIKAPKLHWMSIELNAKELEIPPESKRPEGLEWIIQYAPYLRVLQVNNVRLENEAWASALHRLPHLTHFSIQAGLISPTTLSCLWGTMMPAWKLEQLPPMMTTPACPRLEMLTIKERFALEEGTLKSVKALWNEVKARRKENGVGRGVRDLDFFEEMVMEAISKGMAWRKNYY